MTPATEAISITRGQGGQVEAEGVLDSLARDVLSRAGFVFEPSLRGHWVRLPFDMGRDWESEHATWAAEMLSAARYPVRLDPALRHGAPAPVVAPGPRRPAAMTAQAPPGRAPLMPTPPGETYPRHPHSRYRRPGLPGTRLPAAHGCPGPRD